LVAGKVRFFSSLIGIRVAGIDTPELRGKCFEEINRARAAKRITVEMVRNADVIELRSMKRDKYFRIVADVYLDGKSLGEELIRTGLARPYNGGPKISWCNN